MTYRTFVPFVALAFLSSVAFAEETADRQPSKFTYKAFDSGTAEQLAQPTPGRPVGKVRVVKAPALVGEARVSSTASGSTSNLTGGAGATAAANATRAMTAPVQFTPAVRVTGAAAQALVDEAAPSTPSEAAEPNPHDRLLVDRNAQLVKAYHDAYPNAERYAAATVVEPQPQQLVLYGGQQQRYVYGNTYGTYSPADYHGRIVYGSYANYYTGYYRPQVYVSSGYCAPSYGYASYGYGGGYCGPRYSSYYRPTYYASYSSHYGSRYSGGYSGGYCSTPRYYSYPRFSIGYSRGGHCGSRFGFRIGF